VSIRLNKLLAQAGLGARRKCDTLVQSGAVRVNGTVVLEPGLAVEPERDRIEVHGRPLPPRDRPAYFVLHKPVGVISTMSDPEGRRTLRDFQPPGARVFPVGRLDADTSGLLILTNDGSLAHHLMHPRYGVTKLYRVHVDRAPSPEMLRRLREGIEFEPGVRSAPARVRVRDETPGASVIELELHEGRYRQVRRMCEAAGLSVLRLHRWGYGPLRLAGLERGLWRELTEEEVRRLRAGSARPQPRPPGAGGAGSRGRPEGWRPRSAPDERRARSGAPGGSTARGGLRQTRRGGPAPPSRGGRARSGAHGGGTARGGRRLTRTGGLAPASRGGRVRSGAQGRSTARRGRRQTRSGGAAAPLRGGRARSAPGFRTGRRRRG